MGGIVTFNTDDLKDKITGSPILIEKVSIDEKVIQSQISDTIILPANYKLLLIDLAVPWFGNSENLLLEYSLNGHGWKKTPVMPVQRLQLLENVSSGYNELMIRKRTGFANDSYVYKIITPKKEKQLYEHWWFFPVIAIAGLLLVWLLVRWKTDSINRKRKLLQKRVDEQTSELSKTIEIKDLLVNIISHDMTNPLRHISVVAEVLEKGLEKDPEKSRSALSDIRTTSDKLLTSSFNLINWMNYSNKKVAIKKSLVNLKELADNVVEVYRPVAQSKNIQLKNEIDGTLEVRIDQVIVSTIINNLLSNAIKYSTEKEVMISAETDIDLNNIILRVSDKGKDIKTELLWVIREVLAGNIKAIKTTTKLNTCLGYVMISELIRLHQLTLTVESEEGVGTVVSLMIPVANVNGEDLNKPES